MTDQDTSSADPDALFRFAEAGLCMDADLESGAASLAAAIAEFEATCTGYPHGFGQELADELRGLARRSRELDLWVRSVAQQFAEADAGAVVIQTVGFNADASVLAQEDWLGQLWQAFVAELPPEVAAQVVVLLNAGSVVGALMLAGVEHAAPNDDGDMFHHIELSADGTPAAGAWECGGEADVLNTRSTGLIEQVELPVAGWTLTTDSPDTWEPILPLVTDGGDNNPFKVPLPGGHQRPLEIPPLPVPEPEPMIGGVLGQPVLIPLGGGILPAYVPPPKRDLPGFPDARPAPPEDAGAGRAEQASEALEGWRLDPRMGLPAWSS